MTKLVHLGVCDDDCECDAFFNESGEILHVIDGSDGVWDTEYMTPLLEKLGFEVEFVDGQGEWRDQYPQYFKALNEWFGWGYDTTTTTLKTLHTFGSNIVEGEYLEFDYYNHEGRFGHRQVVTFNIVFGTTDWHTTPQWLLVAHDLDKHARREFAMKDMSNVAVFEPTSEMQVEYGDLRFR